MNWCEKRSTKELGGGKEARIGASVKGKKCACVPLHTRTTRERLNNDTFPALCQSGSWVHKLGGHILGWNVQEQHPAASSA